MFSYTVNDFADEEAFEHACGFVERLLKCFCKKELLVDVDGSKIQFYEDDNGQKVKVCNDYEIDAVYIDSEIKMSIEDAREVLLS